MQFFVRLLFLTFIFSIGLTAQAAGLKEKTKSISNDKLAGYRVIRASPYDFRIALWMNEANIKGPAKSRLAQFVKIKNKKIHKDFISFEVIPNITLFQGDYTFNQLTEFVISGPQTTAKEYRLDILIVNKEKKNFVKGHIDVEPHEQGSLLTFFVEKSSFSDFTIDLLIKTFQLIQVTSKDQKSASSQTLKERIE